MYWLSSHFLSSWTFLWFCVFWIREHFFEFVNMYLNQPGWYFQFASIFGMHKHFLNAQILFLICEHFFHSPRIYFKFVNILWIRKHFSNTQTFLNSWPFSYHNHILNSWTFWESMKIFLIHHEQFFLNSCVFLESMDILFSTWTFFESWTFLEFANIFNTFWIRGYFLS